MELLCHCISRVIAKVLNFREVALCLNPLEGDQETSQKIELNFVEMLLRNRFFREIC